MHLSQYLYWLGVSALVLHLAGCSLMRLREESQAFYSATVLVGRVENPGAVGTPVVVAAYRGRGGQIEVAHYTRLHEAGSYELIVPDGNYRLFAFADTNANYRYDAGEAVGQFQSAGGKEVAVTPAAGGIVVGLDFVLSAQPAASTDIAVGTRVTATPPARTHSTQIGALAALDDAAFSAESGRRGYWEPVAFFRELGGNVYFLEPYDPHKIPILFVHGAAGSPQDWQAFIKGIDRSRYQPWLFFYPSGSSVESMSHLLYWKLLNLQIRYGAPRIYITAHSMGGLLVRNFLENYAAVFPQVQLFVSIATPWQGDSAAETGTRYSPAVVPSWQDMRPDGRFLNTLFQKPVPAHTPYYLMFAHRGSPGLLRQNNDGTVTLASQLRPAAQAAARQVLGFDEGHVGVLASPEVLRQYKAILASTAQTAPAGRLQLTIDMPMEAGPVPPLAMLTLQPREAGRDRIVTTLAQGKEIGMLPPGEYLASMFAYGYLASPATQVVTVKADQAQVLRFALQPSTVLAGYLVESASPGAQPAGQFPRLAEAVRLKSVRLDGPTGTRQLVVSDGSLDDIIAHYQRGEDFAIGSHFSFVNLQPGNYRLHIQADGHLPYTAEYRLEAGGNPVAKPIALQRR